MSTKIIALFLALTAFFGVEAQQVMLHSDCGYRGQMVALSPGNYTASQHRMRIRDLSSIQIPAGLAVNLFSSDFFNGQYITLTQSSDCLIKQNFNDEMVSLQIYQTGGNYLQQNQSPVMAFERCNFGGRSEPMNEGSYQQLSMGFSRVQAIRVAPGYAVIFQKEVRQAYGGTTLTNEEFRGDQTCLPIGWGNSVRSAFVYRLSNVYDNYWNTNPQVINNFNQGAVVYEAANYQGRAQTLSQGAYRGYQLDQVGGERVISSFKLSPGYRLVAFSGSNFDGARTVFTASNTNLGFMTGWNDRISSIIVERTDGGGGAVIVNPTPYPNNQGTIPANLPYDKVTVFSGNNLSGGKWSAGPGSYRSNQILYIGPGTIQSIYVPNGFRLIGYTGSSLNGNSRVFEAGTYNALSQNAPGWNRAINSMVVELVNNYNPQPVNPSPGNVNTGNAITAFIHADYSGSSAVYGVGSYTAQQLGGTFVRSISSIQIPPGFKVTVYEGPTFNGESRILSYSINNFAIEGQGRWNDRIQSMVIERDGYPSQQVNTNVPTRPQPTATNDVVMAYADAMYQGSTQNLPVGSYTANQMPGTPPRTISSIRIPPGYKVTVFDGPNFNGDYRVLTYSIDNFVSEGGGKWNDRISSIIVERTNY